MRIIDKIKKVGTLSIIDSLYKKLIYKDLLISLFPFLLKKKMQLAKEKQEETISKIKKKKLITVAFFIQTPTTWKYERLYRLFEKNERYNPIVIITPYNVHLYYDKNECLKVVKQTQQFVLQQQYNFYNAYNQDNNKWTDIKKMINPDIIFFTKPYKDTLPLYHLYNFIDKLTCYVPYGFLCVDIYRINYNLAFHNLLWKFFVETEFQHSFSKQYALNKGQNVVVTGSLGTELFIDKTYIPKDVWKPQTVRKKRIIWAPHHTLFDLFNFSTFLTFCDFMLELAQKYEDKIQFAFKPHPVLKFKLINLWGKEKTDNYYKQWNNIPNGQLEEGAYTDLFLTSDAMIHDCASFTAEYLYTLKPVAYLVKGEQILEHLNPFGRMAFDMHYHVSNDNEIDDFIQNIVIKGNDIMHDEREIFFNTYLYPKDNILPSQKILNLLEKELC